MLLRRSAAACFGLLALLPALAACGDDESGIKVGDLVDARADDQFVEGGTASTIALPIGRLEISAGKPTTKLAADDTRQLQAVEAPAGSTFVPITWQYDAGTFGDYTDFLDTEVNPVIDLVADKASYRLPAPEPTGEGAESFYALVSGDGEDASLSVDFDGVKQTVELATGEREEGKAAPLYKLKPRKDRIASCTTDSKFKLSITHSRLPDYACNISRSATIPYAGGQWAEAGKSWRVVTLSTTLRRYDLLSDDLKSGAIYVATSTDSSFTLGKLKPTKVIEDRALTACPDEVQGGCTKVYHLIFAVDDKASTTLRMNQTYELTLSSVWGGGEGRDGLKLTNKAVIKLR